MSTSKGLLPRAGRCRVGVGPTGGGPWAPLTCSPSQQLSFLPPLSPSQPPILGSLESPTVCLSILHPAGLWGSPGLPALLPLYAALHLVLEADLPGGLERAPCSPQDMSRVQTGPWRYGVSVGGLGEMLLSYVLRTGAPTSSSSQQGDCRGQGTPPTHADASSQAAAAPPHPGPPSGVQASSALL